MKKILTRKKVWITALIAIMVIGLVRILTGNASERGGSPDGPVARLKAVMPPSDSVSGMSITRKNAAPKRSAQRSESASKDDAELFSKCMDLIKNWERTHSSPVSFTSSRDGPGAGFIYIPPPDSDLIESLKGLMSENRQVDEASLKKLLARADMPIDKHRAVVYQAHESKPELDSLATMFLDRKEDIGFDSAGVLQINGSRMRGASGDGLNRYAHLFSTSEAPSN